MSAGTARVAGALLVAAAVAIGACGGPTPSPSPLPSAAEPVADIVIDLVAQDVALQPGMMTVPAGVEIQVHFDNRDVGVPHNVVLLADANFSTTLIKSEIVNGPAKQDITIAGLIPGRYRFSCEVHPNMASDLFVEPPPVP